MKYYKNKNKTTKSQKARVRKWNMKIFLFICFTSRIIDLFFIFFEFSLEKKRQLKTFLTLVKFIMSID